MARRRAREIVFHRTLLATRGGGGGPKTATAVDWHLKAKDIGYDVILTKSYCITISMQKISSIHKLILKKVQILGFHYLNSHTIFDHTYPKNH